MNELPYEMKMEVIEKCRLEDYEKLRYVNNSWYSVSNDKNVLYNVLWNEYKDDIIINITNRKWLKKIDVNMLIKFFKKTEKKTYHIHKLFIEAILQNRIDIIRYILKIIKFSYTKTFFEEMINNLDNMNWDDEFKVLKYLIHLIKKGKISKPNKIYKIIKERMSTNLEGIEFLVKKCKVEVIDIMELVMDKYIDISIQCFYKCWHDEFIKFHEYYCYMKKRHIEKIKYLVNIAKVKTEEILELESDFAHRIKFSDEMIISLRNEYKK